MNIFRQTFYCFLSTAISIIILTACQNAQFTVEGSISNASDSILFFENMALDGIKTVDSVKLDASGRFSFKGERPEAPDFFRLRIANQTINLSIDSTETITIKAQYPQMAMGYDVQGSENCTKIRQLTMLQYQLQAAATQIVNDPTLGIKATEDSLMATINRYKQRVTIDYIYREPMKAYAYFALFQYITVGNSYIMLFDPQRYPDDVKAFAAVATNWDANYSKSLRTENLHNIALEGMRDKRIVDRQNDGLVIDADKFGEINLIDIALNDNHGNLRRLTDLKGKVVLLDFHRFGSEGSTERIMMLRDIYNRYHARGLEIFQVAIGTEEHFWKTQTAALPWINVRDADGSASNAYLAPAPAIPCDYLINRENIVVRGAADMTDIARAIETVL